VPFNETIDYNQDKGLEIDNYSVLEETLWGGINQSERADMLVLKKAVLLPERGFPCPKKLMLKYKFLIPGA